MRAMTTREVQPVVWSQMRQDGANGNDLQILFEDRELRFCGWHPTYAHKILRKTGCFAEYDLLADARRFLLPNEVVIDVGAHIGNHTIFFAAVCQSFVLAFEPDAQNYLALQRTVAVNGLQDQVKTYQAAVSSANGFGHMVDGPRGTPGTRRLAVTSDGAVPVIRLDDVMPKERVRIMKIDVEGHELQVLLGATQLIERDRPRLYIECLTEGHFSDLAQHLAEFGYRAMACFGGSPTFAFSAKASSDLMSSSDLEFGIAAIHQRSVRARDVANVKATRKRQAQRVAKAKSALRREAQRAAKAEAALERITKSGAYRMARLLTWPARKLSKLWRSHVRLEPTGCSAIGPHRK